MATLINKYANYIKFSLTFREMSSASFFRRFASRVCVVTAMSFSNSFTDWYAHILSRKYSLRLSVVL